MRTERHVGLGPATRLDLRCSSPICVRSQGAHGRGAEVSMHVALDNDVRLPPRVSIPLGAQKEASLRITNGDAWFCRLTRLWSAPSVGVSSDDPRSPEGRAMASLSKASEN